jgi:hypothetical protein
VEAGDVGGDVFDRRRTEVAQFLFGGRGDGHRNVLHVFFALSRRDDHLLGDFRLLLFLLLLLLRRLGFLSENRQGRQDDGG